MSSSRQIDAIAWEQWIETERNYRYYSGLADRYRKRATLALPRLLSGPPVGLPGSSLAVEAIQCTRPGVQLRRAGDAVLVQHVAHFVGHLAVLVGELNLVRCGGQSGSGSSVRPISVSARSR